MNEEKKIIRLGGLYDAEKEHQIYSVFDKNAICRTLDTAGGGASALHN